MNRFSLRVSLLSEPVLSGSETVLHFDINISPWQAFQISVSSSVCLLRVVDVERTKCVCSSPASVLAWCTCFSSRCQKNAHSKPLSPSGRGLRDLSHGRFSVWGVHEPHGHSGKAPELARLPLINIYTEKYCIPL